MRRFYHALARLRKKSWTVSGRIDVLRLRCPKLLASTLRYSSETGCFCPVTAVCMSEEGIYYDSDFELENAAKVMRMSRLDANKVVAAADQPSSFLRRKVERLDEGDRTRYFMLKKMYLLLGLPLPKKKAV